MGAGPPRYFRDVLAGPNTAVNWQLDGTRSQGAVLGPKSIEFTSTNRTGVVVTNAHDQFNNPTPYASACVVEPGLGCPFVFPPYGQVDSVHTSGGITGDTLFFHVNVTQPATLVLRALYNPASGQVQDSILITMNAQAAGVVIDRDQYTFGVQTSPDTTVFNSICPVRQPDFYCQREFAAFVVDSGLAPMGNGNAAMQWTLIPATGGPVTLDLVHGAPASDTALVTARGDGFARLIVKDVSVNNFGTDTLPILVQQLPYTVQVTPDTVSVLVGGTTTFRRSRTRSMFPYWPLHCRP